MSAVTIYGPDGRELAPSKPNKTRALAGGSSGWGGVPYDAADLYGRNEDWLPWLWSPDAAINPFRDRIVSRAKDLARNDGWAFGGITRILDSAIGACFRPISRPDYRALAHYTGNSRFDAVWAHEYGRAATACWRTYAHDQGRWCDSARRLTLPQIMYLGFRHKLVDGDALGVLRYQPERIGLGKARYATTTMLIHPDRLSNPQMRFDDHQLRGGVEVDPADDVTVAYHIRRAHPGDWWDASRSLEWERIPRETPWGRPIVVHDFDCLEAGQHRGGAGVLTPVMDRMKMLAKYDSAELQAAIINAIFASYLESPFDPALAGEALTSDQDSLGRYQDARSEFHKDRRLTLGDNPIPTLFPGEKIQSVSANRPATNFRDFEGSVLRNIASGLGLSAQQLSNDWSDVNYSSARGALIEFWKTLHRRREDFAIGFATPIWSAWLEEAMEVDDLPMPSGGEVPEFIEYRTAFAAAHWLGPGRGWVDPVAEKQGAALGMDIGVDTLEEICAEQGKDAEEVLDRRAVEVQMFKDRGLPVPTWANLQTATEVSKKPEAV